MATLLRSLTLTEHKWFARILLKDLKINFSGQQMLNLIGGKRAADLFNQNASLKYVLGELCKVDNEVSFSSFVSRLVISQSVGTTNTPANIIPFSRIKPMLSNRLLMCGIEDVFSRYNSTFHVETKYDGERIICHFDRTISKLMLFTRNGKDYSNIYGPSLEKIIQHKV